MSNPSNVVRIDDPTIPINQNIYEESTSKACRVGTRLRVGDRTFHYAKAGAALVAGQVVCSPTLIASHQDPIITCGTAAAGATTITVTMGTLVTADQYAEGFLAICDTASAGAGLLLKIKSHPAVATATSGTFTLYDAIPYAITAQGVGLAYNPFASVIIGSQALGQPVGVAPIAVTSGNYFWAQTFGVANVKHVAATPVAAVVHLGTLGGVVCTFDATTNGGIAGVAKQLGWNMLVASATRMSPVFLTIIP